jgi:ribitol-5-phosphate 2-dehydrogenase
MLHHIYGVGTDRLQVFGAISDKLDNFKFAQTDLVQEYDFNSSKSFDIAVECTGGRFSESAVNQAIDILSPGGVLILMGVTEERVPINTRDVLERGITMIGSSRSSAADYYPVVKAMRDPACQETLRRILPNEHIEVRGAEQFTAAMEEAAEHRGWKKTILAFNWK